jgi:hypothetical protein
MVVESFGCLIIDLFHNSDLNQVKPSLVLCSSSSLLSWSVVDFLLSHFNNCLNKAKLCITRGVSALHALFKKTHIFYPAKIYNYFLAWFLRYSFSSNFCHHGNGGAAVDPFI